MAENKENKVRVAALSSKRYRGRLAQIPIYLGKFLRMFIYQNDWKVIPISAIIAIIVGSVVKGGLFVTMEGTVKGGLALTSIALWNGFFNSIQVVCRERGIIKREHRSGMHISSYIIAHMIYQAVLCALQAFTTIIVFNYMNIKFPTDKGIMTGSFILDILITIFLISYAADMLSLFVSCVVKSTTAAMTVMPLVLMVQLIFSGGMFSLPKSMDSVKKLMISNQGMSCICAEGDFNNLTSNSGWNQIAKLAKDPDADPETVAMVQMLEANGYDDQIRAKTAKANYNKNYECTKENISGKWWTLIGFSMFFAILAIIALERIDKDRR